VTDLRSDSAAGIEEAELDQVVVRAVRDLFTTLAKAFRAFQLYDENNPVRQRFVNQLREAFTNLWQEVDQLTLGVEEHRFLLGPEEVYRAEHRGDSLAFLFFKDGIRAVTFLPGVEGEELERYLAMLQKARKLSPEGDDLLTVLWEEGLEYFQYQYVDLLAEGVDLPQAGGGSSPQALQQVLAEAEEEERDEHEEARPGEAATEAPPQTVSKDDFNPTLYALDPREIRTLREELDKEIKRDVRGDVLAALFDRLEDPGNPERQSRILGILGTLLPNFLSRGVFGPATEVLAELRRLEAQEGVFDEARMAESRALLDRLSDTETVEELIQALMDGSIRTTPEQLGRFLQYLRAGALGPLLRAAETTEAKGLQTVLREAVQGIANRNRAAVVALLGEADPVLAAGAARLAGDMQITEAGPALADLLAHPDASVRLAAVEAAVNLKASVAARALQETLDDPEREIRIAAARALAELRYTPAAGRLATLLRGKEIRGADISEKVAVFEAYGAVAGERGVALLDKLLNGKGFLGRRESSEIRAAAALALGQIGGAAATAALRQAASVDDPVVRSAVGRAMRGER